MHRRILGSLLVLGSGLSGPALAGDVLAVGSPGTPALTREDLSDLLLGQLRFREGIRLRAALDAGAADRVVSAVTGLDPAHFERYWLAERFRGNTSEPERVAAVSLALAAAAERPGTVAFVPEAALPQDSGLVVLVHLQLAAEPVPSAVRATMLERVVDHDRSKSPDSPLRLSLVGGERCADELGRELNGNPRFQVTRVTADDLPEGLAGVDVAWLCEGADLGETFALAAEQHRVLTVTASGDAGRLVAVLVEVVDGLPHLVVNLERARSVGSELDAGLLRVAEVR